MKCPNCGGPMAVSKMENPDGKENTTLRVRECQECRSTVRTMEVMLRDSLRDAAGLPTAAREKKRLLWNAALDVVARNKAYIVGAIE